MKTIEDLIREKVDRSPIQKAIDAPPRNNRADKNCDYDDFIEMLRKVLTNVIPECRFVSYEDIRDLMQPDVRLETPLISFEVVKREPRRTQKPMLRNEVIEKAYSPDEERIGTCFAWEMDYSIQFNIFASGYEKAQSVMNKFEEAILSYSGYFKKNGVVEILFKQQLKDSTLETFREHASVRSLQYYVILEKYWIDFESTLESVMIQNKNEKGDR